MSTRQRNYLPSVFFGHSANCVTSSIRGIKPSALYWSAPNGLGTTPASSVSLSLSFSIEASSTPPPPSIFHPRPCPLPMFSIRGCRPPSSLLHPSVPAPPPPAGSSKDGPRRRLSRQRAVAMGPWRRQGRAPGGGFPGDEACSGDGPGSRRRQGRATAAASLAAGRATAAVGARCGGGGFGQRGGHGREGLGAVASTAARRAAVMGPSLGGGRGGLWWWLPRQRGVQWRR